MLGFKCKCLKVLDFITLSFIKLGSDWIVCVHAEIKSLRELRDLFHGRDCALQSHNM